MITPQKSTPAAFPTSGSLSLTLGGKRSVRKVIWICAPALRVSAAGTTQRNTRRNVFTSSAQMVGDRKM